MISNEQYLKLKKCVDNIIHTNYYNNMLSEKEYYLMMSFFRSSYKVDLNKRMFVTTPDVIYYNDDIHYNMTTKYKPFTKKLENSMINNGCLEVIKTSNEYTKYSLSYREFVDFITDGGIYISDGTCTNEEMEEYISKNNIKYVKKDIGQFKPKYKNNITRNSPEYKNFVNVVLERDNYTCQCCGSTLNPDVHHKYNYAQHKDLRTDADNGIVLCQCCHSPMIKGSFHNTYGTRNNTPEQLEEYIYNKRKELGLE